MSKNLIKDVSYYRAQLGQSHSPEDWQQLLDEVTIILAGMEKGLALLEKLERKPEKKVLENHRHFQQLKEELKKRLLRG